MTGSSAPLDAGRFATEYQRAVTDVMRFISRERQELLAVHDSSMHPDRYDLGGYLRLSETRYQHAVDLINRRLAGRKDISLHDAGGFLAAFPLALARLGVRTTLSEKYAYYHGAFDDLRSYLIENGVAIWDLDVTDPDEPLPDEQFDVVTNMAMIEHLAHTPRPLLENLHRLVADDGRLVIEVPNIAYWPTRLRVLKGGTPYAGIEHVYRADPPYVGHHREYTREDLALVLDWSGFEVDELFTFNYSWSYRADPIRTAYYNLVYRWPIRRFESCWEVIMACAHKRPASAV